MNILTFDIEDWFHILDNKSTKSEKEWLKFEPRIDENVDRILIALDEKGIKATFFCLGWIAKKHPHIIKNISSRGHEIGTHSQRHQLVYEQNPKEFRIDLLESIANLEDLTGERVRSYRAPGFSLTRDCLWSFDVLIESGIEIDCSIFPAMRSHGGIHDFPNKKPFIIEKNGNELKEFPMSTVGFGSLGFAFAGGGYFRLFPYKLIKELAKKSDYVMTYFHPRDFDPGQPIIKNLSSTRKFKSYYGLNSSFDKFKKFINEFEFISLGKAEALINWDFSDRVKL
jgi:polysaccharide deacetylase family protein (PEP-CTERM system associated)